METNGASLKIPYDIENYLASFGENLFMVG